MSEFDLIKFKGYDKPIDEFNLDERIFFMDDEEGEPTRLPKDNIGKEVIREDALLLKDVKEFIRRRNELDFDLRTGKINFLEHCEKKNKLAGNKLIDNPLKETQENSAVRGFNSLNPEDILTKENLKDD